MTSKDQPVYQPSMARVRIHPSLDSRETVEGIFDQRRLCSDCMEAQADLCLHWLGKSDCRFCCALAHISNQNTTFEELLKTNIIK